MIDDEAVLAELNMWKDMYHVAERDAARYRWLRSCTPSDENLFIGSDGMDGWTMDKGDDLDATIDEAIQARPVV